MAFAMFKQVFSYVYGCPTFLSVCVTIWSRRWLKRSLDGNFLSLWSTGSLDAMESQSCIIDYVGSSLTGLKQLFPIFSGESGQILQELTLKEILQRILFVLVLAAVDRKELIRKVLSLLLISYDKYKNVCQEEDSLSLWQSFSEGSMLCSVNTEWSFHSSCSGLLFLKRCFFKCDVGNSSQMLRKIKWLI